MLEKLDIKEFDIIYSIMINSFPDDEYRPNDEQIKLLENKNYSILVMRNEKKQIIAFIAVWDFTEFLFIEHFAVDKDNRNKGFGKIILNELKTITRKMLCLEVEPPQCEITKRRVEFYKRNGFYLNEYPYIQPSISSGKKPVPLMIMTSENKIDNSKFESIKKCIYENVYKITQ